MGPLPGEVEGGAIVRDVNGKPTGKDSPKHSSEADECPLGIMVDNAMDLVPRPPWTEHQMQEYFTLTMKDALGHGLTSIHDADSQPDAISLFKR